MKASSVLFQTTLLLITSFYAGAAEVVVEPQIESVGAFKNGLAVVRASFNVPGPGSYRWEQVPQAIHATFSVTSDAVLTTRSTRRLVDDLTDQGQPRMQEALAGKNVVVTLSGEHGQPATTISGRIWQPPTPEPKSDPTSSGGASLGPSRYSAVGVGEQNDFVILETTVGRQYINRQRIASISAEGPFLPVSRQVVKPVFVFEVTAGSGKVTLSYLTRGITWFPAYHLDITDLSTLTIRQSAVVRNELFNLKDTDVALISGYPNIQFSHVNSPLDPDLSLASFFRQLNQTEGTAQGTMSQMISSNGLFVDSSSQLPPSIEPDLASTDIHYQMIGKKDLEQGDSLALDIASASARYTRIVKWQVPESRDSDGKSITSRNDRDAPDPEAQPWDALRFSNPFQFPMTTAPASITEAGKFRGQSLSTWVNPSEPTILRITQALTLRATASEVEAENNREEPKPEDVSTFHGSRYRRILIEGTLKIHNFRSTEAALLIQCRLHGKLLDAELKPELKLLHPSSYLNHRSELSWNTALKPGADQTIQYRYHTWVSY